MVIETKHYTDEVLRAIVEVLSADVDIVPPPLNEDLIAMATQQLNITDELPGI